MLNTLSKKQRDLLRQQLDEAEIAEANQSAVEQDFGQTFTPQREYVDQAAGLINEIEQATGQPTGFDPYAGQGNSRLKREPQGVIKPEDEPIEIPQEITQEQREFLGTAWPIYKKEVELKKKQNREPQSEGALNFLKDPYGSVMKTIAPDQNVKRPMTPLTSSVVETLAPTPKQVVTPLEQRGAQNKKVPPPQIPKMVGNVPMQKTQQVATIGTRIAGPKSTVS